MTSKILGGLIIIFWVVMMSALVRLEYTGKMVAFETVPTSRVAEKILNHPSPGRLNILSVGQDRTNWIGYCYLDVVKLATFTPLRAAGETERHCGYQLQGNARMDVAVLGWASRWHLTANGLLGLRGTVKEFDLRAEIGDGWVEVRSPDARQVEVVIELGEVHEHRTFNLQEFRGAGLAGAFGMPGIAGLGLKPTGIRSSQPTWQVGYERLTGRLGTQRAYAVEYRLDANLWIRAWVSEVGEILRVETPWGVTLLDDQLVPEGLPGQPLPRARAKQVNAHDSNRTTH
jgi:hypothetical protein